MMQRRRRVEEARKAFGQVERAGTRNNASPRLREFRPMVAFLLPRPRKRHNSVITCHKGSPGSCSDGIGHVHLQELSGHFCANFA